MRILSLAPSNTEILYALGAGDDIVGVTAFCDWPSAARSKPKVGGWTNVSGNLLERFAPDVIVTSMYVPPELQELHAAHPERFCHVDPHTLEGVSASILTIGERVGRAAEARMLMERMRVEFEGIRAASASRPKIRAYIEEWSKPPMASGNWVPEVVAAVGIEQVIVRSGERSRAFRFDELRTADPEVIVLSICGAGDRVPTQELLNRVEWGVLRAVRERRIAVIDDSLLNRPGPRLPQGAQALAAAVERVLLPAR